HRHHYHHWVLPGPLPPVGARPRWAPRRRRRPLEDPGPAAAGGGLRPARAGEGHPRAPHPGADLPIRRGPRRHRARGAPVGGDEGGSRRGRGVGAAWTGFGPACWSWTSRRAPPPTTWSTGCAGPWTCAGSATPAPSTRSPRASFPSAWARPPASLASWARGTSSTARRFAWASPPRPTTRPG